MARSFAFLFCELAVVLICCRLYWEASELCEAVQKDELTVTEHRFHWIAAVLRLRRHGVALQKFVHTRSRPRR